MNENKKGTCKCVDYSKKNNEYFIKQRKTKKKIEDLKCNKPVKKGTDFCKKHQDCKKFLKKFTSGSEPKYDKKKWSKPYTLSSHNCYTYFLDDVMPKVRKKCEKLCKKHNKGNCPTKTSQCRKLIPQPGDEYLLDKYGDLDEKSYDYTCKDMEDKIFKDNPILYKEQLTKKCKKGFYKGAMVADPGNTFHFYRQNPDGTWSHKPGTLPITKKDADKMPIYIPSTANKDYSEPDDDDPINYTEFCGYYCIPSNKKAKTKAA